MNEEMQGMAAMGVPQRQPQQAMQMTVQQVITLAKTGELRQLSIKDDTEAVVGFDGIAFAQDKSNKAFDVTKKQLALAVAAVSSSAFTFCTPVPKEPVIIPKGDCALPELNGTIRDALSIISVPA